MMAAVAEARHGVLAALPQTASCRDRLDQLADAMHDERDLRAVSAAAHRSGHRREQLRVLLLQPGPAAGQSRLRRPCRAPVAEWVQEKLTAQWIERCLIRLERRAAA